MDNTHQVKTIESKTYSDEFKQYLHELVDNEDVKGLLEALQNCRSLIIKSDV
ncbi:TPA: hypothetical protein ACS777_003573 [Providencia alcalifaciens]